MTKWFDAKQAIVIFLVVFFYVAPSESLTFKSDGSIIQKSGAVVAESFANRFLSEIKKPTKNWRKSTGSKNQVIGYFGDDIFVPGTPLLRIQGIKRGEEYLEAVYRLNGFSGKQSLYRYIVANATPEFVMEMGLSEDDVQSYLDASLEAFVKDTGLAETELGKRVIEAQTFASQSALNIDRAVEDSVATTIEMQLEESVSDAIEEAVEEAVDNWLDALIARYNINPEAIIEIGDGWVSIDCSLTEC